MTDGIPIARTISGIHLTHAAAGALDRLCELEELRATDIINRALQIYALVREEQVKGNELAIITPGTSTVTQIRWE